MTLLNVMTSIASPHKVVVRRIPEFSFYVFALGFGLKVWQLIIVLIKIVFKFSDSYNAHPILTDALVKMLKSGAKWGRHGGAAATTVTSEQGSYRFDSHLGLSVWS